MTEQDPFTQRLLPQSPDAEQGVLGSMMIAPETLDLCAQHGTTEEWFHIPAHRLIFISLRELIQNKLPSDFISLTGKLSDNGELKQCGGSAFITNLFTFVPSAVYADHYLGILREKWMRREAIQKAAELVEAMYSDSEPPESLIGSVAVKLSELPGIGPKKARTFKDAIFDKMDRLEKNQASEDVIKTGIEMLDQASPMRLGSMPMIVGERKAGKSILAMNIAAAEAEAGRPVLFFTLENPEAPTVDRLTARKSGIPIIRHYAGILNEGEINRINVALMTLAKEPWIIRDDCFDIGTLCAVSKQTKTEHPNLRVIVVDYAQLVRGNASKGSNREQDVASVSRSLRLLSMELKVAVILLAQLNEQGKSRESRSLEQDVTACWYIQHCDDQGHPTKSEDDNTQHGVRLLTIPYQRDGDSGIGFRVSFQGAVYRISGFHNEQEKRTPYADN